MTRDQIAELRGKGLLDSDQLWDAVDTLLDEREALLEALHKAVLFLYPGVTFGDMDAARRQAEGAIAKAEAP